MTRTQRTDGLKRSEEENEQDVGMDSEEREVEDATQISSLGKGVVSESCHSQGLRIGAGAGKLG